MTEWKGKLLGYGEKAVKIGSDLAEVVVRLQEKPSILAVATVAARTLSAYREAMVVDPSEYFAAWDPLSLGSFGNFVIRLLEGFLQEKPQVGEKHRGTIFAGEIHGLGFGFVKYDSWVDGPWVPGGQDVDASLQTLGRVIWEALGPAVQIVPTLQGTVLERDVSTNCYESATAVALHERISRFVRAGYSRSVLLHGEPGTGKSHIMRHVAKLAGAHSLRCHAKHLDNMRGISVPIKMLRPSALLIDDIDRLEHPEGILSEVDEIRESATILICTVNSMKKLDLALLRPDRFDVLEEVTKLDEGVLDHLIGDVAPDVVARLRSLPIAYIGEFHRIRKVLGEEEALAEVRTLQERAEDVRKRWQEEGGGKDGDEKGKKEETVEKCQPG